VRKIKVEPTAADRQAAKAMFSMFTALVDEGFTDEQALVIIGQMLSNVFEHLEDEEP
jgi:hypothetical protein